MASRTGCVLRITKEIRDLQKSNDLSIQAAFRNENVQIVRALIVGPPDTPYEFGFYEFNFKFPATYPLHPPKVRAITTDYGRTRFNPNIYSTGLVCLSTLGTWRGEAGEDWSTALGLESVLISIQSLMSANPYENEPGYEHYGHNRAAVRYAAKIHHENLRIAVVQRLETMLGIRKQTDVDLEKAKALRDPDKMGVMYDYDDFNDSLDPEDEDDHEDPVSISKPQAVPFKPKKTPWTGLEAKSSQTVTETHAGTGTPAKKQKTGPHFKPHANASAYNTDTDFDPFCDVTKLRFLWYFDVYMNAVENSIKPKPESEGDDKPNTKRGKVSVYLMDDSLDGLSPESELDELEEMYEMGLYPGRASKSKANPPPPAAIWEGMQFRLESFESKCNGMTGSYCYTGLRERLKTIRATIDEETKFWSVQGAEAVKNQKGIALEMRKDFEQIKQQNEKGLYESSFDIELIDNNPFMWQMTLFGKYSTNLEGAVINIRICFSPKFPEEQPRVSVLTPLFHHRITKTGGILCYVPSNSDDAHKHIAAIIQAIEDDDPRYDPRTKVNLEAAELLWGGDDKKKIYNRKVRRSVQDSLESS